MQFLEETSRPWGKYQKFFHDEAIWVKRLEVHPKSRLSLQKHHGRHEKWIIVQGRGLAIIDGRQIPVAAGSIIEIPLGAIHRMCNLSDDLLVFVEVAHGDYLAEDDIVRYDDDYQRVTEEKLVAR
jgi:mannose-6-phosphate isomerase-like protein (cupin superfamily)